MFYKKWSGGFTLVELLVVISIISLIAAMIFTQLQSSRARARDAEREEEIKTLQTAIALYVINNHTYPVYTGEITGSDPLSVALLNDNAISQMPFDPLKSGIYTYSYDSINGSTYTITYHLETDSISGKNSGLQTASP